MNAFFRRLFSAFFLLFSLTANAHSQNAQDKEIKVKYIEASPQDLEARTHPREDNNGVKCALIKVIVPSVKGMVFKGWVMGNVEYQPGEYRVYVPVGTKKISFQHENYPSGEIRFNIPIESQCVYKVVLDVPTLATSFEELIEIAREYSRSYRDHTESSYYLAAVTAYDQAIGHNDCPQNERDAIYEERNRMAAIRKTAYFRERTDTLARKAEAEKGFESDEVYKYLGGEFKFISKLVEEHPEVSGFKPIKEEVYQRLLKHPKATESLREEVTVQRQQITGIVSIENDHFPIPLSSLNVYASPTEKIDRKNCRLIGRVKADGTFTIVVPDDMKYIFVDGEKKNAHHIYPNDTKVYISIR